MADGNVATGNGTTKKKSKPRQQTEFSLAHSFISKVNKLEKKLADLKAKCPPDVLELIEFQKQRAAKAAQQQQPPKK